LTAVQYLLECGLSIYAIGALSAGLIPDSFGLSWELLRLPGLTFFSGAVVGQFMRRHSGHSLDLASETA